MADDIARRWKDARKLRDSFAEEQGKRKESFDKAVGRVVLYEPGEIVRYHKPAIKPGERKKLIDKWPTPQVVVRRSAPETYVL